MSEHQKQLQDLVESLDFDARDRAGYISHKKEADIAYYLAACNSLSIADSTLNIVKAIDAQTEVLKDIKHTLRDLSDRTDPMR